MKGTMLRCAAVAQREAARQRREATANFTGVFATEMPLKPAGWLTVAIESLKHPPMQMRGSAEEGATNEQVPDLTLTVAVRAAGAEQLAFSAPLPENGVMQNEADMFLHPPDQVYFGAKLTFQVHRQHLRDRGQQIALEVLSSAGVHGIVLLPLQRVAQPGSEHDGLYELVDPRDRINVVRGYKQHSESFPSAVHIRFSWKAAAQPERSLAFCRGPVTPFSDRDLGMVRPQSMHQNKMMPQRPQSAQIHRSRLDPMGVEAWRALGANGSEAVDKVGFSRQIATRPQTAHSEAPAYYEPRRNFAKRTAGFPPRPQSADPRHGQRREWRPLLESRSIRVDLSESLQAFQIESRTVSPGVSNGPKRPSSATVRANPVFRDVLRESHKIRPASAGPSRRFADHPAAVVTNENVPGPKNQLLIIPIARKAELHPPVQESVHDLVQVLAPESGTEGNASIISKASSEEGGCGLSPQGRSILYQIEASVRDWGSLQTLLQFPKDQILQIISGIFDNVKGHQEDSLSWEKLGEAMVLLFGKPFSEGELVGLCARYCLSSGSDIDKMRFTEVAVDALFLIAQDELGDKSLANNMSVTRCAQRLRFLRMDFCSPGKLNSGASHLQQEDQGTELCGDGNKSLENVHDELAKQPARQDAKGLNQVDYKRQQSAPARRPATPQLGVKKRMPIMMPAVGSPVVNLACVGHSLT